MSVYQTEKANTRVLNLNLSKYNIQLTFLIHGSSVVVTVWKSLSTRCKGFSFFTLIRS